MKRIMKGCALIVIISCAVIAAAQKAGDSDLSVPDLAAQLGVFTDHVEVTVTNLYVTVTDRKGDPVVGLGPADFVVKEDGTTVEITHFAAYSPEPVEPVPPGPQGETEPAEDDLAPVQTYSSGTRVALLFDNSSLRAKDRARVVAELREFGLGVLERDGKVMVATANDSLNLVSGLTDSPDQLFTALDRVKETRSDGDALATRKRMLERDIYQSPLKDPRESIPDYGAAMALRFESQIDAYRATEMDRVRRAFASLEEMLRMLNGIPGRTSVLWIGQDMPLQPGLDLYQLLYDKFNLVAPLDVPEIWGTEQDLSREVQLLSGVAQTGPVTVHYLDAADRARDSGTADLGAASGESVLVSGNSMSYGPDPIRIRSVTEGSQVMAESTGGTSLVGTRNVTPYLDRLGNLLEAYYSIGYVRPGSPDGSLHSVKVEVTRPGLRVNTQHKVRNAPRDERLADVCLSRLQLDDGVNTIGMKLTLGEPQSQEHSRAVVRNLGVRIPAESVILVPVDGGAVGQLMIAIRVLDRKGVPSRPQIDQGPVTVPDGATEVFFQLPLKIPRGTQRIGVAIRDELSGVEASSVLMLDG